MLLLLLYNMMLQYRTIALHLTILHDSPDLTITTDLHLLTIIIIILEMIQWKLTTLAQIEDLIITNLQMHPAVTIIAIIIIITTTTGTIIITIIIIKRDLVAIVLTVANLDTLQRIALGKEINFVFWRNNLKPL